MSHYHVGEYSEMWCELADEMAEGSHLSGTLEEIEETENATILHVRSSMTDRIWELVGPWRTHPGHPDWNIMDAELSEPDGDPE